MPVLLIILSSEEIYAIWNKTKFFENFLFLRSTAPSMASTAKLCANILLLTLFASPVKSEMCSSEDTVNYFACEFNVHQYVAPKYVATRIFGVSERVCLLEAGKFKAPSG